MEKFEIKSYTKKELALLYFPESTPTNATARLMAWIKRNKPLWQHLLALGYQPTCKTLSPKQVTAIAEYLGEP